MQKYDLIFIDADDTLFDYYCAEQFALTQTFNEFKLDLTNNIVAKYSEINSLLWSKFEKGEIVQEKLRTERFRLLFKHYKLNCDEFLFSERYLKWLSEGSFLIEDAEQICEYLNEKYILSIITNGIKEAQMPRFINSNISKYIQHIIISEDAKFSKPNVGIFDYAMNKIGFYEKNRILIIGDSLTSDIKGGINYGIDTCWLNNKAIENNTGIVPNYQISRLSEIKHIL